MKKKPTPEMNDELRPEYDLRQLLKGGVRGKRGRRGQVLNHYFSLDAHWSDVRLLLAAERER